MTKQPRLQRCKGFCRDGKPCMKYASHEGYCEFHHPLFQDKIKKQKQSTKKVKGKYVRRYIYQDTYNEVMKFGKDLKTPNNKSNFPFTLQQYINYLKFKWGEKK